MRIFIIAATGALVLTQYQNCSAPEGLRNTPLTADGSVRVIEDWNQGKVSFVDSLVELQSEANQIAIEGLCDRSHSENMVWQLRTLSGEQVFDGLTTCLGGGFALHMDNLNELSCGLEYELIVKNQKGESSVLTLNRRCPPLFAILSEEDSTFPGNCFLEKMAGQTGDVCQRVCYAEGRVYYLENRKPEFCASLVSQNN